MHRTRVAVIFLVVGTALAVGLAVSPVDRPQAPPTQSNGGEDHGRPALLSPHDAHRPESSSPLVLLLRYPHPSRLKHSRVIVAIDPVPRRRPRIRATVVYTSQLVPSSKVDGDDQVEVTRLMASDSAVRLVVAGLAPGSYEVSAKSVGPSLPALASETTRVDIPASAPSEIRLVSVDRASAYLYARLRDGAAEVVGASLNVINENGAIVGAGSLPLRNPIRLRPGTYTVRVSSFPGSEDRASPAPQQIVVGAGEFAEVTFALPRVPSVLIRAEDADGAQHAFGLSLWDIANPRRPRYVNVTALCSVLPSGAWRCDLPAGEYVAAGSSSEDLSLGRVRFDVVRGGDRSVVLPVKEIEHGSRVEVLVQEGGRPLAKQRLNINRVTDAFEDVAAWGGRTDAGGRAVSHLLPRGRYAVWLWDHALVARLDLDGQSRQKLVIDLEASPYCESDESKCVTFGGTVRDEAGQVAAIRKVVALRQGEMLHPFARVGHDGRFRFTDIREGEYRLWVVPSFYTPTLYSEFLGDPLTVLSGRDAQDVAIRLLVDRRR